VSSPIARQRAARAAQKGFAGCVVGALGGTTAGKATVGSLVSLTVDGVRGARNDDCNCWPIGVSFDPSGVANAESAPSAWLPLSIPQKIAPASPALSAATTDAITELPCGFWLTPSNALPNSSITGNSPLD
jgi:hypothetical protein